MSTPSRHGVLWSGLVLIVAGTITACMSQPAPGPPTVTYRIPFRTIAVDGNQDDWQSIDASFTDQVDDLHPGADLPGTDIHRLYIAADDEYLYLMVVLHGGSPRTDTQYIFQANRSNRSYDTPGDRLASVNFHDGQWHLYVAARTAGGIDMITEYPAQYVGTGLNLVECRILLSDIGPIQDRYIRIYAHITDNPDVSDDNLTNIRLRLP